MSIADDIKRLHDLHRDGALSEVEFERAKARLFADEARGAAQSSDLMSQLNLFRRSRADRWLGGVCGGMAKMSGLDSWIWRLIFFVFTLYFGVGVVIYILAWIFVPDEA